ncbi:MAG: hypothetical protein Q8858_01830 [Bacteroidota bacterium]|nr:hypothetical protein [Bacteroidota bacterium]
MANLSIKLPDLIEQDKPAEKCGFALSAAVRANFDIFSLPQKKLIQKLTGRPTLSASAESVVSPSGHFRIHYEVNGDYAPSYDPLLSVKENVKKIAAAFDSAYSFEVNFLGFPAPPPDGSLGGDNLYDVYIVNEDQGNYGTTEIDAEKIGANTYTSFIYIDNDYVGSGYATHSFDAAMVTAAHELHHAIQMGCYAYKDDDIFFHEMTSTAMEDFVFDSINDYCREGFIRQYFNRPTQNYFVTTYPQDGNGYRLAIWDIFLKEKYGYEIIKRQWELYKNYPALKAIQLSLLEKHSSFRNELNDFGIWTYFTGYRALPGKYFKDGAYYPTISYLIKTSYSESLFPLTLTQRPLTNMFLAFLVKTGERTDTIAVKITNGDFTGALNDPSSEVQIKYDVSEVQKDGFKKLTNNLYSCLSSPYLNYFMEEDFFNDEHLDSLNSIVPYSQIDAPYPNPYSYLDYSTSGLSLPVSYNDTRQAEIRIYSVGMNLIYSGNGTIFDDKTSKKYYVSWNCIDSKGQRLSTGVYLYVTSSNGEIKKGKFVIKNDH